MDKNLIKKDRMRYTKNKASANFTYLAILFNVLYFVSIYSSDSGKYYYTITIGISVVYNLLFLLFTFLSSEGLKSYKLGYAVAIIIIGAMQIVRIFEIPLGASRELITGTDEFVMGQSQFIYTTVMLVLSAVCCIVAGAIGLIRTLTLREYNRTHTIDEINSQESEN